MLVSFFSGSISVASDWGVKRLRPDEVQRIYVASRFYFEQGDYKRAADTLAAIPEYQRPLTRAHIEALKIVRWWSSHKFKKGLTRLEAVGLPLDGLHKSVCYYVLDNYLFNMFAYCAQRIDGFSDMADDSIQRMLRAFYQDKVNPFSSHIPLSTLVNKYELTRKMPVDIKLVRERILALLEETDCNRSPSDDNEDQRKYYRRCQIPVSAILSDVRDFIYR
jgi:hypothetical protein